MVLLHENWRKERVVCKESNPCPWLYKPKTDQRLVLLNQLLQLLAATVCVCVQASLDLRDLLALRYIERILASKASLGCSQYID